MNSASLLGQLVQPRANQSGFVKIALRIFRAVICRVWKNAPIFANLGDGLILLPIEHSLPSYRFSAPLYDSALPRIVAFLEDRYDRSPIVIDIGANVGDTAWSILRKTKASVIAVEGNPEFLPFLRHNLSPFGSRASLVESYVSIESTPSEAKVITQAGTARIVHSAGEGSQHIRTIDIQTILSTSRPDLIKIDTDGYDIEIIRSIIKHQYIMDIFFEYYPKLFDEVSDDGDNVFHELLGSGFSYAIVYLNTGELIGKIALDDPGAVQRIIVLARSLGLRNSYLDIFVTRVGARGELLLTAELEAARQISSPVQRSGAAK